MATFRAIHPYVREAAFRYGFEPAPDDDYKVQHPTLRGKKAQVAFYKAFSEAKKMPGVRTVATPGTASGRTLLFPQVPEARWEAARRGIPWVEPRREIYIPGRVVDRSTRFVDHSLMPKPSRARNATFNGVLDNEGCLVNFQIVTTDDGTARKLIEAMRLGTR